MRISIITLLLFASAVTSRAQENDPGFFTQYWQAVYARVPGHLETRLPDTIPEIVIRVNAADTLIKISPFIGGYNLNTFFGGKYFDKTGLLEHMRNLEMPFFRFPGGSGSDFYFWDAVKPDKPEDVDTWLVKGVEKSTIKWGDEPGSDYLSLDNYYRLRDSTANQGIHVVNYAYARYGTSVEPVLKAAHYAANWVRYDRGRTTFWEIGNENYGAWEAGYEIDTSLNQDGQPRYLTGALYAGHCKIFLDSMRAAATEIGAEIKIGAVLGFKNQYDSWNRAVLNELGNQSDFYSLHKYYGNGNNAGVPEMLNAINEFYSDKTYINGLIRQYCDPFVPLVETEWNTRYDGANQNVSCANGLFTMLGFKGIINTGIGLSSKWNLVWGYQDGESHGLITNSKDNPDVEGLPAFTPRAPFFYSYFFRRILGDVSVRNSISSPGGLDIFSSAFSSGHMGVVIVNKSGKTISAGLNFENYELGARYYWHTLTPADDQPLSREVEVNGRGNEDYEAGGPADYSEIPAYSALTGGGIVLTLSPYSVTYLLAEGSTSPVPPGYKTDLSIFGRTSEGAIPLKGALVRLGNLLYLTNDEGQVSMELPEGRYSYHAEAIGYLADSGKMEISGPAALSDTLEMDPLYVGMKNGSLDNEIPGFQLIPNPAGTMVLVKHTVPIKRLEIFNASGESILIDESASREERIADLHNVPAGLYFVRIEDTNMDIKTEKLLINR